MFEDLLSDDGKLDCLCSFELFEHLNKPKVFLEQASNVLETGGYLLLTTLNGKGGDIQLLWEKHKNVNPPHHFNFTNPEAFKYVMEATGLEIISVRTPGRLDWDIVEKMMENEGVDFGRWWNTVCGAGDKTKSELQTWISHNNYSSHIRIVAKKVR